MNEREIELGGDGHEHASVERIPQRDCGSVHIRISRVVDGREVKPCNDAKIVTHEVADFF